VEKLSQRLLRVEFLRDLDVDLFCDFLKLLNTCVFNQAISRWATKRACVVGGCDCERVFIVLEYEPDDVVDRVDSLVDLVTTQC